MSEPNNEPKAENKKNDQPQNGRTQDRVVQIMNADGWRAYEFTQDDGGTTEMVEIPVVGWGLHESGKVALLISIPNGSNGYAAMSIDEYPSHSVERYRNKSLHYQAVAPFQKIEDFKDEAEFVLKFMRSNGSPWQSKMKGSTVSAALAK